LLNANSIKQALDESFGNSSNSKTSVITIDESRCILPKIKVEGITKYHSVAFDGESVKFWQYFDIGSGLSKKLIDCNCTLHTSIVESFTEGPNSNKEFLMKNTLSSAMFFCSNDRCSATFDNEEQLMQHEQNDEHIYTEDHPLSTLDRARYLYIEHLKVAHLVEEMSSKEAIESLEKSDIENIQFKHNNDEIIRTFLTEGYAIRLRQKTTKITQDHREFFKKLFHEGEKTGKKVTAEKAYQEMRVAMKPNNMKLFTPKQYLSKNQIRGLFGRFSKKRLDGSTTQQIQNSEMEDMSPSSEEDNAEEYFRTQQIDELEDLKANEIEHAFNYCSDDEDNTNEIN
jgi:hypothetical protein